MILLMMLSVTLIRGQHPAAFTDRMNSGDIPLVFNQEEFDGRLSVLAISADEYDYYVVDLTRFEDRLERIYFLNLAYGEQRLISISHELEGGQLWFKAHHQFPEAEITCLLSDMKERSHTDCAGMSTEEKTAWLVKYDKYDKK